MTDQAPAPRQGLQGRDYERRHHRLNVRLAVGLATLADGVDQLRSFPLGWGNDAR